MSFFYNVSAAFTDENGNPYAGGKLFFGEENVDPIQNPQDIFLDEGLTIPADNPQTLGTRGTPLQTVYMTGGAVRYSQLLQDADENQIFNFPSTIGVGIPADLNNVPAVTIIDSATIKGVTDAKLILDSGVAAGSEGEVLFQESAVNQWRLFRQAIVDGGAIILRKLAGTGAPDDPIEFPVAGGMIARWLGTDRLRVESDGVAILGDIKNNNGVLVAAGTFLHNGTAVGKTLHITSAGNNAAGDYDIILDFFPVAEADLNVSTSAELAGAEMITRGVGGTGGSGSVSVFCSTDAGVRTNATSFTVQVFDLGRV